MSKLKTKMLDIDLDIVEDSEGRALMRDGEDQSFAGVKTFNAPPHSEMHKPEAENTAVTKAMLKNVTRCMNTLFTEELVVSTEDLANGYIKLSKEIPKDKETSLEITYFDGAGTMINGVDFGVESDRIILTGYLIEDNLYVGDKIEVRYMICDDQVTTLENVKKIIYAPELGEAGRFVAFADRCIYWSEDGVEWIKGVEILSDDEWASFNSADYSPTLRRFVASYGDSFLISDDGKTWTQVDGEPGTVIWAGKLGAFYCFAWNENVYRSTDGQNWSKIAENSGLDTLNNIQIAWNEARGKFFCLRRHEYADEWGYTSWSGVSFEYSSNGIDWTDIGKYEKQGDIYKNGWSCDVYFNPSPYVMCISPTRILARSECYHDDEERYEDIRLFSVSKDDGATWTLYAEYIESWGHNTGAGGFTNHYPEIVPFAYISELDIFLGTGLYQNIDGGNNVPFAMAFSKDGETWNGTNDLSMSQVFCYAPDRDTMLFARGSIIEVVTDFSSVIRGSVLWRHIPLRKLEFELDPPAPDPGTSGGGSGGSGGYGGNDKPIEDLGPYTRGINLGNPSAGDPNIGI